MFKSAKAALDILPDEVKVWQIVKAATLKVCEKFGFLKIILPTFEN